MAEEGRRNHVGRARSIDLDLDYVLDHESEHSQYAEDGVLVLTSCGDAIWLNEQSSDYFICHIDIFDEWILNETVERIIRCADREGCILEYYAWINVMQDEPIPFIFDCTWNEDLSLRHAH